MEHSQVKPLLFIISGASGSGKKTLIDHVVATFPEVVRIPTFTTRLPRNREQKGVDYNFIDNETFIQKFESGEIFECTKTYGDYLYGSPQKLLDAGDPTNYIIELDYKGMFRVRERSLRRVVTLFILSPGGETLSKRIQKRAEEKNLDARVKLAQEQTQFAWAYDYAVLNDDLDEFKNDVSAIVRAELLRDEGKELLLKRRHEDDMTLQDLKTK